jgi:hypothetical protein
VRRAPTVADATAPGRFLPIAVLAVIIVMTFAAIAGSRRRGRW